MKRRLLLALVAMLSIALGAAPQNQSLVSVHTPTQTNYSADGSPDPDDCDHCWE